MATRLYFSSTEPSPIYVPEDGTWNFYPSFLRRKLNHTKDTSAITVGTRIGPWTPGQKALDRVYVSDPMKAGVVFKISPVADKVRAQLMMREYNNADNVTKFIIVVRIYGRTGTPVRETILQSYIGGTCGEFINNVNHRNVQFSVTGAPLSVAYTTQAGDRLVVDIGYTDTAGSTPEASSKWGENATDLPENCTQTSNGAGWIEFDTDIEWEGDAVTLTAEKGTFITTGNNSNYSRVKRLISEAGTYITTGVSNLFSFIRKLTTDAGIYTTTGNNTNYSKIKTLVSEAGTYLSTGIDNSFSFIRKLITGTGSFVVTGNNSAFKRLRKLISQVGSFILTGKNATFTYTPPTGNTPINNDELRRIAQYITNFPPPFYNVVTDFVNDMYTTGARPEELLQLNRWNQSLLDPEYWTLLPQKNNNTREILKSSLSESLNYAIINNTEPYQSLTLRQLEYSIQQINPVGKLFADTKEIIAYLYRYNRVRQYVEDGVTQNDISNIFGWVSPTIIATYTNKQILVKFDTIPTETFFINDEANNRIIDSNNDIIISQ